MDKYELIKSVILQLDELVDARGAKKCTLIIDMIQKLDALAKGLGDEDKAHKAEKQLLEDQLKKLTTPLPIREGEERIGGGSYNLNFLEGDQDAEGNTQPGN